MTHMGQNSPKTLLHLSSLEVFKHYGSYNKILTEMNSNVTKMIFQAELEKIMENKTENFAQKVEKPPSPSDRNLN